MIVQLQDIEMASSQLNPAINWEASNLEEFMGPLKKTSAEEQSAYFTHLDRRNREKNVQILELSRARQQKY